MSDEAGAETEIHKMFLSFLLRHTVMRVDVLELKATTTKQKMQESYKVLTFHTGSSLKNIRDDLK